MKPSFAVALLLSAFPTHGFSTVIYDVDFEAPTHTVGMPVTVNGNSDTPSGASSGVTVAAGAGDLATQVAIMGSDAMTFVNPAASAAGIIMISWDIVILDLGITPPLNVVSSSIEDTDPPTGIIADIDFTSGFDVVVNSSVVGSYTLAQHNSMEFIIDPSVQTFDFFMDNSLLLDDEPYSFAGEIPDGVLFSRASLAEPSFAVDNFQWQIIPEPSSLLLAILGGLGLLVRRRAL